MDAYLANQDYKATWSLQETVNSEKRPGMRGGHQLIIDSANSVMYLFGGWDGFEDLSDLWCYNIKRNSWHLIHDRSETYGGPTPRSCHKMVYDPHNSQIFTLGRYLDSNTRTQEYLKVCRKCPIISKKSFNTRSYSDSQSKLKYFFSFFPN